MVDRTRLPLRRSRRLRTTVSWRQRPCRHAKPQDWNTEPTHISSRRSPARLARASHRSANDRADALTEPLRAIMQIPDAAYDDELGFCLQRSTIDLLDRGRRVA